VACAAYCVRSVPAELARARPVYAAREWMRMAGGFMSAAVAVAIYERIDLVIMGIIAPATEVAAYAVAARFAQTVVVAASGAWAVMAPHLVERLPDLQAGRRAAVQRLVCETARTSFYVSIVALALFATLAPWLLKLFGPHYERAYVPLVLLAAGQSICALFGPAAGVATLAGAPRVAVAAMACGITVNVTLSLLLVPALGANGAALATAGGMICASLVAWTWTRRRFFLDTSVFRTEPL
jgi:O-antigen/teichoic acid export membrane protein